MRSASSHRKRPSLVRGALTVLAALLATAAGAQTYDGQPIADIHFEGLSALSESTLRFYLGLEEGQDLTAASLNERIHLLWDRDLVDDIEVRTEPMEGGVRLTIKVMERPTLSAIEYTGLKRLERTDISDRISRDLIRVREGDALNLGELYRLKAAIEEMYEEKGYRLAEARFSIEESGRNSRRVVFTIDEGDKVRLAEIDFEGNTVFGDRRLRWAMKDTKETDLLHRILRKDVYEEAKFEEDLDKVRDVYRKAGYKNLVIGEPEIEIKAEKPEASSLKEQKRRMFVTIPIEEGQRWRLGGITINGNDTFTDDLLLAQFKKPRGGWLRSNVIDDGVEAISDLYQNTGHLFARVDSELVEKDEEVADVVVNVEEGDQFRVGRFEFIGNTLTKDKVIRRELGIQEGLVLSTGALRNSLLRIRQLEFFKIDEDNPVNFDFDNEAKTANLTIKGEEGDRTELLFGGGYSEVDGFFGQLQFRTRNFLGRGETLGVSIQAGARQDIFDVSYSVPWFLDRPQTLGVQVFDRTLDYSLLTGQQLFQKSRGGNLSYGRRLGLFKSVGITYGRYDLTDHREQFDVFGNLIQQDFMRNISTVRLSYNYDKRDSRLWPTSGLGYSFGIDYAGGILGGSTDYWRPRANFSLYHPLTKGQVKTIAAVNLETGFIQPLNDQTLYFNDRYYLGGESSIRGHRYRSIWARDSEGNTIVDADGYPLGGEKFLQANFEYHVLLGGPFRLLAFVDLGNVFAADQSLDLGLLRQTAGFELQVNVPLLGAPLRFIYAFNLDEKPDDRFESFQFSIGPSF